MAALLGLIALSGSRRARAADDAPPTVVVDVTTLDPRVRIDRVEGDRSVGTVCWSPCGIPLDARAVYAITGDGIPATRPFVLTDAPSRVTLDVRPGSAAERVVGWVLLFVGGAAVGVGGAPHDSFPTASDPHPRSSPLPLLIALGGLVVGSAGLLMILDAPTQVYSSTGRSFSSPGLDP